MGIVEIIVILAVALIVIPPENLPDVIRAAGKILRELRLASNMVMRELGGALDQPSENQPAPSINTMKPIPIATGANTAQSAAAAGSAPLADAKVSVDPTTPANPANAPAQAEPIVESTESPAVSAGPGPAPAAPKAID